MVSDQLKERPVVAALEARDSGLIASGKLEFGELTLEIDARRIVEVCSFLKHDQGFNRLSTVTAVDWYPVDPRFEVVYHLHSLERNERLRLKCKVSGEQAEIDSVCSVWRGADWYEREVFDLFGINFRTHPNMIRIMMPEGWEGHPLRKDYPVHGYKYSYSDE
jgi:NADH (or F420H2) dehydrogenase, subunit C